MSTPNTPSNIKSDQVRNFAVSVCERLDFPLAAQRGKFLQSLAASFSRVPKLAQCLNSPEGKISVYTAAESARGMGLDIGRNCYILPYFNKKTGKTTAQLIVGYAGAIQMVSRIEGVKLYRPVVVYENDNFSYGQGVEGGKNIDFIRHQAATGNRGKPVAGFIRWEINGASDFLVLHLDQIQKRRSETGVAGTAQRPSTIEKYPDDLIAKTLIFRACKYLPAGTEENSILAISANVMPEHEKEIASNPIMDSTTASAPAQLVDDKPPPKTGNRGGQKKNPPAAQSAPPQTAAVPADEGGEEEGGGDGSNPPDGGDPMDSPF